MPGNITTQLGTTGSLSPSQTALSGEIWDGVIDPNLGDNGDNGGSGTNGEKIQIASLFPQISVNSSSQTVRLVDNNVVESVSRIVQPGPVTVTASSPGAEYEVRYTVNGKNPTFNSTLYTDPIMLTRNLTGSDNTVLKFRAYSRTNNTVRSKVTKIVISVY